MTSIPPWSYPIPPWSYSSLTKFETCPKQYYHLRVARDVVDTSTEASQWGSRIHEYLERRVRDGEPLPESAAGYESIAASIANHAGDKLVEHKLCINSELKPTQWSAPDAWCRGIVDVGVIGKEKMVLLDYKTGKRRPESSQLKLFAALAFASYERINVVMTGFVWLKHNAVDKQTFKREDVPVIWQEFLPRVQRLERAYETNNFPPKPSGLCSRYCPVPKHKCEFSGRE